MNNIEQLKKELDAAFSRLNMRFADAVVARNEISQLEAEVWVAQEARQEADTLAAQHAAVITRLEMEKREILAMAWDLHDQMDEGFDTQPMEHIKVARTMDAAIEHVIAWAEREKDQIIYGL